MSAQNTLSKTVTAYNAKTHFGNLIIEAQHTPIKITKNGKEVAVMISIEEFNLIDMMKHKYLNDRLSNGLAAIEAEEFLSEDDVFASILESK